MALSPVSRNVIGGLLGGAVLGCLFVLLRVFGQEQNGPPNLLLAAAFGALTGLAIALGARLLRR